MHRRGMTSSLPCSRGCERMTLLEKTAVLQLGISLITLGLLVVLVLKS